MNDWLKSDAGWFGVDHFPDRADRSRGDDDDPPAHADGSDDAAPSDAESPT